MYRSLSEVITLFDVNYVHIVLRFKTARCAAYTTHMVRPADPRSVAQYVRCDELKVFNYRMQTEQFPSRVALSRV